jgi:hypothetical protein
MPTYIRFSEDHSVAVEEGVAEIERLIRESEAAKVPLFEAIRTDGARMVINANEIRTISEGRKKDSGGKR